MVAELGGRLEESSDKNCFEKEREDLCLGGCQRSLGPSIENWQLDLARGRSEVCRHGWCYILAGCLSADQVCLIHRGTELATENMLYR